ncbi:MAG TPA: hypothetical protein H9923_07805 [Candidatus Dwaynia gallinarum]|nr:hypothetical protein A6P36_04490 [Candidatus Arthromitus sp. SFB-turkey]HJD00821.1 hypothetical protein [Candidatus Dwaynia gallinarum]
MLENLYTVKELSQKYNVSEKIIYSNLKSNEELKENIIYKGKRTYLNEEGAKLLNDILCKEIEIEEELEENFTRPEQIQINTDIKQIENDDIVHRIQNIKDSIVDKTSAEEAVGILLEQIKEKDNLIKRLVSLIESNQVILEKDREQLLEDTRYYKTLEMLEERAIKFDENIPYLRNKLDCKKNTRKWWKKNTD